VPASSVGLVDCEDKGLELTGLSSITDSAEAQISVIKKSSNNKTGKSKSLGRGASYLLGEK
jgi:hypothetical protein